MVETSCQREGSGLCYRNFGLFPSSDDEQEGKDLFSPEQVDFWLQEEGESFYLSQFNIWLLKPT